MKISTRASLLPAVAITLLVALPAAILLSGCGGGSGSAPTVPFVPIGASFTLSGFSGDFNGNKSPFKGGSATFTRRKTATTDGLDATVVVGTNPERAVTVSISTAGALSVGQRFRIGVSDDFTSSTGLQYTESRPDQSQLWVTQGGPGVSGSVTIVALNENKVILRVENAEFSRREGDGPPAAGSFTINGTLLASKS